MNMDMGVICLQMMNILWDGYLIDKKDCNRFKNMILCSSSL